MSKISELSLGDYDVLMQVLCRGMLIVKCYTCVKDDVIWEIFVPSS